MTRIGPGKYFESGTREPLGVFAPSLSESSITLYKKVSAFQCFQRQNLSEKNFIHLSRRPYVNLDIIIANAEGILYSIRQSHITDFLTTLARLNQNSST